MGQTKLTEAVALLKKEIKKDKEYKDTWVANIAMPFQDEYRRWRKKNPGKRPNNEDLQKISNKSANDFLDILCDNIKYPAGR